MEAKMISQRAVKNMINGNTALLHIGNFDTGKRTNLKRAVSECVYTSRLYYNKELQSDNEKIEYLVYSQPYRVFKVELYETHIAAFNEYTEYHIDFDDTSKYYTLVISGMQFLIVSDLGWCNIYQVFDSVVEELDKVFCRKNMEALTGNTWENPYKPENEHFALKLTDEERTLTENRIKDGYYTSEAIQAREDQKKREEYEKKRNEIIADYEKEIQKAENRKLVRLAVLDTGIPLKNVIYYNHTNELAFNWNDYEEKVTQEQFDKFVNTVDKNKLPKNITFKLK